MNKHVMVTGGRGYIGYLLTSLLLDNYYEVTVVDTNYFPGFLEDPCFLETSFRVVSQTPNYLHKNFLDLTKEDLAGIDCIIHLAALSNDPMGELDPGLTEIINHKGTSNLAALAKSAGVSRFVFSSSCSVYGSTEAPAAETHAVNPLTAYAKSKIDAEQDLSALASEEFCPVFMRNATVYGHSPKMRLDLVVNDLVASAYLNGEVKLLSDGSALRPFIHVADLAKVFMTMIEAPTEEVHNQVFNIGNSAENYSIRQVADIIGTQLNTPVVYAAGAQPDKRNYAVDFSKFYAAFPDFSFEHSIETASRTLWKALKANDFRLDDRKHFIRLEVLKTLMANGLDMRGIK